MQLKFKKNFIGYFNFFYKLTGKKLIFYVFLSSLVGFLDGLGLSLFIPLLQIAGGASTGNSEAMGNMRFSLDIIKKMGFSLTINIVLIAMILIFVVKGLIKLYQLNFGVNMQHGVMRKVRNTLVDDLHGLTYQGFLKLDAGRIQNTLIGEIQRLYQSMYFYFNGMQSTFILLTYIVLAFLSNFQFALLVTIGAFLSSFLFKKVNKNTKKSAVEFSVKGHDFNSYLIQAVNHFKYLKSTNYFENFKSKLKGVIKETETLNKRIGFLSSVTISAREPLIIIVVAVVIFVQVNVINSSMTSVLLSLLLFYRALMALMQVQGYSQFFIQNIGAMETVSSLLNEMDVLQEDIIETPIPEFRKSLQVKNVSFAYGENQVLSNINIDIQKNKTIAVVGESGSGKTTLINIIAGLIPANAGNVVIDGVPIKDYNLNSYRKKIGYISQEAVIFNDNIFNNVTFWAEPTEENIRRFWEIIEFSSLSDFVKEQPDKEFTFLGDNGILISGGQKQRISIARELYKKVDILILDEATSALDSETERIIKENIEKLYGSYTLIIVAHRLSTIKTADTIYMLDKGKLSASGDFSEMILHSDKFKYLVSLQSF